MLDVDAVESFTGGRLTADDDETDAILMRALAIVRTYAGWHVTPSRTETITVNGPGSVILALPTAHLTAVTALSENGTAFDVNTGIEWSYSGLVRKTSGAHWTRGYRTVRATITHGYAEAFDFDAAVLQVADRLSVQAAGGPVRRIADLEYFPQPGTQSVLDPILLAPYRIEPQG